VSQLLACISIIFSIIHIERVALPYAWAFYYAHFEILLVNTPTASCVYILVGLSADRYVAACKPNSYRKVSSPTVASFRIALSLILPLMFYIPYCFLAYIECNANGTGYTLVPSGIEKKWAWIVWGWIVELFHRLLPSLLIVIFNINVIIKVRRLNRQFNQKTKKENRNDEDSTQLPKDKRSTRNKKEKSNREQLEKQLSNLLMSIILVFLITTLPAAILALSDSISPFYRSFSYEV